MIGRSVLHLLLHLQQEKFLLAPWQRFTVLGKRMKTFLLRDKMKAAKKEDGTPVYTLGLRVYH